MSVDLLPRDRITAEKAMESARNSGTTTRTCKASDALLDCYTMLTLSRYQETAIGSRARNRQAPYLFCNRKKIANH
jgi:hypothetical protein